MPKSPEPTITLRVPLTAARFFYTVLEYFLGADKDGFKITLTKRQQAVLADVYDELAFQLTTAGPDGEAR